MPFLRHRKITEMLDAEYRIGRTRNDLDLEEARLEGVQAGRDAAVKEIEFSRAVHKEREDFADYRAVERRTEAVRFAVALLPYSPNADPLTIAADVAKFLETGDTAPAGVQETPRQYTEADAEAHLPLTEPDPFDLPVGQWPPAGTA